MPGNPSFNKAIHDWMMIYMRHTMDEFIRHSRSAGLSMSQFGTLFRLHHEGSCGLSKLGDQLGISNPAVSQMIERLVQMGLLERQENPNDRREKQIALTPRGKALVDALMNARQTWINDLGAQLPPQEQEEVIRVFNRLLETAESLDQQVVHI